MRMEEDVKLDFADVLIRPKRSMLNTRADVNLKRNFSFRASGRKYVGVPIIAANMDGVGTMAMAQAFHDQGHGMTVALHKYYPVGKLLKFFNSAAGKSAWYTMGVSKNDVEKLKEFMDGQTRSGRILDKLCLDVPNGYMESFIDAVKRTRDMLPKTIIMAGNVVTGDMTESLISAGADIVKVGIGPGSVCTTRKVTGVGYPQLSATAECADAAHGLKGMICTDGGCTSSGDIAKAFGGGADFVMLGGMLAGHDEAEGKVFDDNGRKKMSFHGMSSEDAMIEHSGGVAKHRASEGKTVTIDYRGAVEGTVRSILGGLNSTCTYVGAAELKELSKRTTFVRVNRQLNNVFGP